MRDADRKDELEMLDKGQLSGLDNALAKELGERLYHDPELNLDELDRVQHGDGFTWDSCNAPGEGRNRYAGYKAHRWDVVKATAREHAKWLLETGGGVGDLKKEDYA